jgi:hypothetical protein
MKKYLSNFIEPNSQKRGSYSKNRMYLLYFLWYIINYYEVLSEKIISVFNWICLSSKKLKWELLLLYLNFHSLYLLIIVYYL